MRWELINSLVLCCGCHRWGHSYPLDFQWWFRLKFPARYDYLTEPIDGAYPIHTKPRCQIVRPIPDSELLEKEAFLKEKLKQLKESSYEQ
jgi:hypothetical protein